MAQMVDTIQQISRIVAEKNEIIRNLMSENEEEIGKLRSDLTVKTNGNKMMNALMRGLKEKLDEEMAKSKQVIREQGEEIQQFSQVVQQ